MVKIAVIFADGMEEIEALTPVDIFRRAGATVNSVSVSGKEVKRFSRNNRDCRRFCRTSRF